MTGHSLAELIVSPERIDYTSIDSPDCFLVISEDGLKRAKARIEKLPETCTVYVDESLELPETKAKVVRLPFAATAKKVTGRKRHILVDVLGLLLTVVVTKANSNA